jgi:hypothetical protein
MRKQEERPVGERPAKWEASTEAVAAVAAVEAVAAVAAAEAVEAARHDVVERRGTLVVLDLIGCRKTWKV